MKGTRTEGMMEKRSQVERLTIAYTLLASVWEEILNGDADSDALQIAVNCQVNLNRIVWALNNENGGNDGPNNN